MELNELVAQINDADMVLVGLGEDFDNQTELKKDKKYVDGCERIKALNLHSLLPAWAIYCTQKQGIGTVKDALFKMQELLKDFHSLTNMKICIYDSDENELCFYPEKFSSFCSLLRSNVEMNERCKNISYVYY